MKVKSSIGKNDFLFLATVTLTVILGDPSAISTFRFIYVNQPPIHTAISSEMKMINWMVQCQGLSPNDIRQTEYTVFSAVVVDNVTNVTCISDLR